METDKIETLCRYLDMINQNLNKCAIILDEPLDIKDIKSPYTLIGVNLENQTYIIMRGYKINSLVNRYLKMKFMLRSFFIIDYKHADLYHYRLEVEDVSVIYHI